MSASVTTGQKEPAAGSNVGRQDGNSSGSGRRIRWLTRVDGRLIALAGLLLVYALSVLTLERAVQFATPSPAPIGRLDRARTFGQTFRPDADELVAVRVHLAAEPDVGDAPVTLRLRYADPGLPDLAAAAVPAGSIARDGMTTFAFAPVTPTFPSDAVTATLRFELAAELAPPQGITILGGPDSYPGGELIAGDARRPEADLAFDLVYRRRWIDAILPVSRMAHGKPGALGWPPLYALLAYLCCLALSRALLALWRAARGAVDAS